MISSPSDGQLIKYSSSLSKWVNYTPTTIINANEAGTLSQMYATFGGGLGGAGIAQNAYFTVPSYIDNSSGSTMLTNYSLSSSVLNISAFTTNSSGITNNGTGLVDNAGWLSNPLRVNVDFGTSHTITKSSAGGFQGGTITVYIYGSNSSSSYNDTNPSNRTTDQNLVLLGSSTFTMGFTIFSQDMTTLFRYIHLFATSTANIGYTTPNLQFYTGTFTASNLVNATDYSIDSDPRTGNPRVKNLGVTNIQGDCNNLAIIWNKLGRRIYPVIRDWNTIKLTDGTHITTSTSTSIPATGLLSATTTISVSSATAPSSGQVLTATST